MKHTLKDRIKAYLKAQGKELEITELYDVFPDEKRTTIRGRVNENIGKGITRVGRGLYISSDVIVEHANIMERIGDMREAGLKYDFIFLDIPYKSAGQRGGKRKIANFDTITPEQFQSMLDGIKDLLSDDGTIHFMITSGSSSRKEVDKYKACFGNAGYVMLKEGSWTKMNANGTRCNIGKYLLPEEEIIVYAKHAMDVTGWNLLYDDVRTLGYPTQKPVSLLEKMVSQATRIGEWILDPFGGSGAMLETCMNLGRCCHIMDISETSIYDYIMPILKR